jgi:hypothetical protein
MVEPVSVGKHVGCDRHDARIAFDGRQIGFLRATGPAIESAI